MWNASLRRVQMSFTNDDVVTSFVNDIW